MTDDELVAAIRAAYKRGAEEMREAVLEIGPANADLIAVGKALFKHTSMASLTAGELGAAAFDASLRLTQAYKAKVLAIELSEVEGVL